MADEANPVPNPCQGIGRRRWHEWLERRVRRNFGGQSGSSDGTSGRRVARGDGLCTTWVSTRTVSDETRAAVNYLDPTSVVAIMATALFDLLFLTLLCRTSSTIDNGPVLERFQSYRLSAVHVFA